MATASPTRSSTPCELTTLAGIRARYELPGPHVTAVVQVPMPGTVGDDLGVRWSAIEADLLALDASPLAVQHMNDLLDSTHRRGRPLLLTANDDDAACCWIGFDIKPSISVGTLPGLLPAVHQAALAVGPTIGAVIDRAGADLYRFGSFDVETMSTVDGDDEHIHKSAAAGDLSQARRQSHSEVVWDRNAALFATHIATEVDRAEANSIVLTGDEREVRLVQAKLDDRHIGPVQHVQAGGRHEPQSPERLRRAALEFRADRHRQDVARSLVDLREELGQHDQAIAGSIEVLEAIVENRVKTLFVDLVVGGRTQHVDATIRAALAHGANVVTGHDFDVHDGIAAILRMPYT